MSKHKNFERQLAAIMFTDIEGYTKSMSVNEELAMSSLKKKRSIIQPLIDQNNGVFVKEMGDGTLSYFNSAIDAVTSAVRLQDLTYNEKHLSIRIGVHLGDILFDGEDVFGEGVNIASRLESLSPGGGVCVSKNVYDELENKENFNGVSLGLQSLKGVGRLIEVYALIGENLKEPDFSKYKDTEVKKHSDDEVPSIAIIPFANKGQEEDIFYAFGISADLISDCAGAGLIRVASLNDIEKLDYKTLDTIDLSKKLDARYIAQGTLWKMGEIFQLSVELFDTKQKKVLWSDRWQEKWDNLPEIKSSLSDGLLKALGTDSKPTTEVHSSNPQAYELYLKSKQIFNNSFDGYSENDKDLISKSFEMIKEAIALDEKNLEFKIWNTHLLFKKGDYKNAETSLKEIIVLASGANDNKSLAKAHSLMSSIFYETGNYLKAIDANKNAIKYFKEDNNQNSLFLTKNRLGGIMHAQGFHDKALEIFGDALDIAHDLEDDAGKVRIYANLAVVNSSKGDFDQAFSLSKKARTLAIDSNSQISYVHIDFNESHWHYEIGNFDKSIQMLDQLEKRLKNSQGDTYLNLSSFIKGSCLFSRGDFESSKQLFLMRINDLETNNNKKMLLANFAYYCLCLKNLDEKFDKIKLYEIIQDNEDEISYELNFRLFELLGEESYLIKAYNQVIHLSKQMNEELQNKFLSYHIQKGIIDNYKLLFPDKN